MSICSERDDLENATMLSIDNRKCSCCGGYFIKIKEDTFRFYYVNAVSFVGLSTKDNDYPIDVRINWEIDSNLICLGDEISVTDLCKID